MSKYKNRKLEVDGITFDSAVEYDFYCKIKMTNGVADVQRQVPFVLLAPFPALEYGGRKTERAVKYIADFVLTFDDGRKEIVDVKGFRTKEYAIKRKLLLNLLFRGQEHGVRFREVRNYEDWRQGQDG